MWTWANRLLTKIKEIEAKYGVRIEIRCDLLNEVFEFGWIPNCLHGSFDAKYLEVPEEVLVTLWRNHQRSMLLWSRWKTLPKLHLFVTETQSVGKQRKWKSLAARFGRRRILLGMWRPKIGDFQILLKIKQCHLLPWEDWFLQKHYDSYGSNHCTFGRKSWFVSGCLLTCSCSSHLQVWLVDRYGWCEFDELKVHKWKILILLLVKLQRYGSRHSWTPHAYISWRRTSREQGRQF